MIKFDGKKIQMVKSKELTPKQLAKYRLLDKTEQAKYLKSLIGMKEYVSLKPLVKEVETQSRTTIKELFDRIKENQDVNHKPLLHTKTSKWVGIEIECLIPDKGRDAESETCYNCNGSGKVTASDRNGYEYRVNCASCGGSGELESEEEGSNYAHENLRAKFTKAGITLCSVKSDGSVRGEYYQTGVEITILLNIENGFDKLRKVCKILNESEAEVNNTCGLHVHLDQTNFTKVQSIRMGTKLNQYYPILSKLVPLNRRNNHYCKPGLSDTEKHYAINMTSLKKHNTIEVRLHSGTTNPDKIQNWIELLHLIVNKRICLTKRVHSLKELTKGLNLNEKLKQYFTERYNKFSDTNTDVKEELGLEQNAA